VDIAWLESFLALIEHGSFTRAAEAQHVSQPAFSRRIRALEAWFGEALVDRSTYPVGLTQAGVKVRASAIDTVTALGLVRDEIRGRQRVPRGAVRVAVTHTLAATFFGQWWASCGDPCVVLATNNLDGYDALVNGACDLLLAYADPELPPSAAAVDVEWLVVATDLLAPYAIAANPQPEVMVTHGPGSFMGRVTDRILAERDLNLVPVAQSDFTAGLASLVRAGLGVGWLPERLVAKDVAAGTLRRVGDSSLTARLEIRLHRLRTDKESGPAASVWRRATETIA
jgi:DNA-binding transcriptional LysR family regulator